MFSTDVIVLLAIATAGLIAARAVGLSAIVAYLVAGVLVGPGVLGWVAHTPAVDQLADVGVALLLFGVGIEFSLERMRRTISRMLASGTLQVGLTFAAGAGAFAAFGTPWPTAILIGFLLALSSTAVVFKLYDDAGEIESPHGLVAAGILLFQDLALVPMALLVPVLARAEARGGAAAMALVEATLAVGVLLFLARAVLPRVLALVARARTPELFPLAALVLALGTARAATAIGLSLPLGAFFAGLALSGSPYSHQVFAELLPLRDAFVAIFFTSVGMLLDPAVLATEPALLAGIVGLVALKGVLVVAILALLWRSVRIAILVGCALAQIGEFSFVLAREGAAAGIFPAAYEQAFLGAAIVTIAATPFLVRLSYRLAALASAAPPPDVPPELENHVMLIGYGVTGQAVARVLHDTGVPFVAVDLLADVVQRAQREGLPVRFGDASRRGTLKSLGVERARAAVVATGDPAATRRIVSLIRQSNPRARILARANRVHEVAELERLGADDAIPAEFETSIELLVRLLHALGVPRHVVRVQESLLRLGHYQALRGVGATPDLLVQARKLILGGILETAQVMKGCAAAGRTLAELDLRRHTGATVLSIVRDEQPQPTPDGPTRLEPGDLIVLYGPHEAIDRALDLVEPRDG